MNNIAPIENSAKPVRERKISKKVRHAIDLLVSGRARTQVDAAAQVGLTRERLCRALKEDHVQGHLESAVKRQLATSQAPAAATLLRLLTEAKSEHVQKDAATTLLSINGIGTDMRGPIVNVGVSVGYVIDLSGSRGDQGARHSAIGPGGGVVFDRDVRGAVINVAAGAAERPSAEPRRVRGDYER